MAKLRVAKPDSCRVRVDETKAKQGGNRLGGNIISSRGGLRRSEEGLVTQKGSATSSGLRDARSSHFSEKETILNLNEFNLVF